MKQNKYKKKKKRKKNQKISQKIFSESLRISSQYI